LRFQKPKKKTKNKKKVFSSQCIALCHQKRAGWEELFFSSRYSPFQRISSSEEKTWSSCFLFFVVDRWQSFRATLSWSSARPFVWQDEKGNVMPTKRGYLSLTK
jgi:hypothetical protein